MLKRLDNALYRCYELCGLISGIFIALIAVAVTVKVVSRLLDAYIPGLTEGAGYLMAASGAFGLAYTFGQNGHIRVSMLIDKTRVLPRYILELWCLLFSSLLIDYLAFHLVKMVYVSWQFGERSDGSYAIYIWIPQSLMAAGFVVFAICLTHAFVTTLVARPAASTKNSAASEYRPVWRKS